MAAAWSGPVRAVVETLTISGCAGAIDLAARRPQPRRPGRPLPGDALARCPLGLQLGLPVDEPDRR